MQVGNIKVNYERLKFALSRLLGLWLIWPNCLDIAYIKSASFGVKALLIQVTANR
jgi:hypothetical protein